MTSTRTIGETEVLETHTAELFQEAVRRAAKLLCQNEVVALPTETVYGLAGNAWSREAVSQIFQIKGRSPENPLIVHVASFEMARACVAVWPESAAALARAFWPGALTLVLPKSASIPDEVTAGGNTVAIRWPSHPFIQAVISTCGFPLAAPSANLSNELSPTTARHVQKSLGSLIPLIVDGGQCQIGIESTVVDLCSEPPRILRPGLITAGAIGAVAGDTGSGGETTGSALLRSPGMLSKHYAPKARLVIAKWDNSRELQQWIAAEHPWAGMVCVISHQLIPSAEHFARVSVIPHDPEAYARALYAELHECDESGADLIVVEAPPDVEAWAGVKDRLRRASGGACWPLCVENP